MALIVLRGREHEPEVRALLPTPVAAGTWNLLGWEENGMLVACAAVERRSPAVVAIRWIVVAPSARGRGLGSALVDAIAAVATAERLVAEVDGESVAFLRRCGFDARPAGAGDNGVYYACERAIAPRPSDADAVGAVTLAELEAAIAESWGPDTSDDPDDWSEANPARGQCAVTALVVRDLLGGEILLANVLLDGRRVERHAWNRLDSGLTLDLTRSQFTRGETFEEPAVDEPIVVDPARYERLAARVRARLTS